MNDHDVELQFLESVPREERRLHIIGADGIEEKERMAYMLDQYQWYGEEITYIKALAKRALLDYNETHEEAKLKDIEEYADMVTNFTWYRGQLREQVKEVRERVRWLRVEYRKMKEQPRS